MPIGIYVHIPFCNGKCPYCDFYSLNSAEDEELKKFYTKAVLKDIERCKNKGVTASTLYFGGGTPNLLGAENIVSIIQSVCEVFGKPEEITVEVNPSSDLSEFISAVKNAGVNRVSVGMQSGVGSELRELGRKHSASDVVRTVETVREQGIENISLDLMVGIPNQTMESLKHSLDFAIGLSPSHISAYLLKIEQGTPFYNKRQSLNIADDDLSADMYLFVSEYLIKNGYGRYEISNFCKKGMESKHNLKYWNCEEYLGFGASAHSYFNGRRFYYPRDIQGYIKGISPTDDGVGGSFEEYAMLALRLSKGISDEQCKKRFGFSIPENMKKSALRLEKMGFVSTENGRISITQRGITVSNTIIEKLIF